MSRRDTDDPLAEHGLSPADLGASLSRVFHGVGGREVDPDHPGWAAAAVRAAAMFADGDDDSQLSFRQFAAMLRRAFSRTTGEEADETEFADLPADLQLAWEAVARHAANACTMDPTDGLDGHEARVIDFVRARLPAPT